MTSLLSRALAAAVPALILTVAPLRAAEGWVDDFAKAKETAAKDNRDLLIDFTGSDWCSWCQQLHGEVFNKDAFKKEAPKHFVLVEIDFPQEKELAPALKAQNDKLQAQYRVEGFPTVVLADAQGRPYAVTGYEEGGAANYLKNLEKFRAVREKRDASFKKAAAAEGVEKAKLIMDALDGIDPGLVHTFYTKEVDEAIAADKADASGAKKSRDTFASENDFKEKIGALEQELSKLQEEEKLEEFAKRIDKFIADEKLEGSRKQELLLGKLSAIGPDKLDDAVKLLDEVIAVDKKSELAEQAKMMKENIGEMRKQQEEEKKNGGAKDSDKPDPDAKEEPEEKEEK